MIRPLYLQLYLPSAARIVLRSEAFLKYVKDRGGVEIEFTDLSFAAISADPQIAAAIERLRKNKVEIDVRPTDIGAMVERSRKLDPDTQLDLDNLAYCALYSPYPMVESVLYYRIFDRNFFATHQLGKTTAPAHLFVAAEDIIADPAGVLR
jgi:hypothetical protein